MHILVIFVDLRGVGFRGKSGKALLEDVHPEWFVASNQHVHSQVELVAIDQQWISHVSRNYRELVHIHVVNIVDD